MQNKESHRGVDVVGGVDGLMNRTRRKLQSQSRSFLRMYYSWRQMAGGLVASTQGVLRDLLYQIATHMLLEVIHC
jgi:hypothetical protein